MSSKNDGIVECCVCTLMDHGSQVFYLDQVIDLEQGV